ACQDAHSLHRLATYVKPPRHADNGFRAAAGLAALQQGDIEKPDAKGALAPRFSPADALAVAFQAKQGAHPSDLPDEKPASAPKTPLVYRRIDWAAFETPDASLSNSRVELAAGLGGAQNSSLLPDISWE